MKASELRDLTREELLEKQRDLSQELFNLRLQKATGQLGNTAMIPKTKRDLARVNTVIRELELSGS
ncbi:MAG: 50S ribosomal protein L29 [Deltaproteobacteria bacterium]|nr:MAG: 50S ribosomal protein L29 [Deltaproteobacteria bacterium]